MCLAWQDEKDCIIHHHIIINPDLPVFDKNHSLDPKKLAPAQQSLPRGKRKNIILRSCSPWSLGLPDLVVSSSCPWTPKAEPPSSPLMMPWITLLATQVLLPIATTLRILWQMFTTLIPHNTCRSSSTPPSKSVDP